MKQPKSLAPLDGLIHHWQWSYLAIEGKIEFIPIRWIRPLMLRKHGTITVISNHEIVNVEQLGRRLIEEGLRYSGVIEVSRETRTARLIAGNHRLLAFEALGGEHLPLYVMIRDRFNQLDHETGIDQSFNLSDRVSMTAGDAVEPPSAVFLDIGDMKSRGLLPPARTWQDLPVD